MNIGYEKNYLDGIGLELFRIDKQSQGSGKGIQLGSKTEVLVAKIELGRSNMK